MKFQPIDASGFHAARKNKVYRGAVLIEVLIVIALICLLVLALLSYFTTVTARITLAGNWSTTSIPVVGPTPVNFKYNVGLNQVTTTTVAGSTSSSKSVSIPIQPGIASVTFKLIGAGGAVFVTGGREYTAVIGATGSADINVVAIANGTDEIETIVNFSGGTYPDTQTIRFETHKP